MSERLLADRYRLEAPLGEGGMALVARATDLQTGSTCAVKVLLPHVAKRRSIRERFAAEARVMVRLAHPHIVQVLDVGEHHDVPFMVMELVPGGSLQTWLQAEGAMPPRQAVEVMIELCRAVEHAHAHGVIHRDIKPHNVLLTASGLPKLSDFGIARTDQGKTKTGAAMGTLGYVAPEQLADAKSATERADVYSLGVTLWKLCTDGKVERLLYELGRNAMGKVPEVLRPVITASLAQDVSKRTPSVAAFREQLEAVVERLPTAKRVSLVHEPDRAHDEELEELWDAFGNTMDGLLDAPESEPPPRRPGGAAPQPYVIGLDDGGRARGDAQAASASPAPRPRLPWMILGVAAVTVLGVVGVGVGAAATYGPAFLAEQQAEVARRTADGAAVAEVLDVAPYAIVELPEEARGDLESSYREIVQAAPADRRERALAFVGRLEAELAKELPEDDARWTAKQRQRMDQVRSLRRSLEAE